MKNEKKPKLIKLTVRLPEHLIKELEEVVKWRKKNEFTAATMQAQIEIAIHVHLLNMKRI